MAAYALLGMGIPVLDAQTPHAARVVEHWEETGSTDCEAAHEAECIVCHATSLKRALADDGAPRIIVAAPATELARSAVTSMQATDRTAGPSSRAPPAL
jgi:hypothetical protein